MEEEKISKLEEYRSRKIKILEEMLELQRRSTIAVESISNSMQQSGNSQPLSMSLSPLNNLSTSLSLNIAAIQLFGITGANGCWTSSSSSVYTMRDTLSFMAKLCCLIAHSIIFVHLSGQ